MDDEEVRLYLADSAERVRALADACHRYAAIVRVLAEGLSDASRWLSVDERERASGVLKTVQSQLGAIDDALAVGLMRSTRGEP